MVDVAATTATEPDPFSSAFDDLMKLGDKPIPANLLDPPPVVTQADAPAADAGKAAATPPATEKPATASTGEETGIVPLPPEDPAAEAAAEAARVAAEAAKTPTVDDSFIRRLADVVARTPDPQERQAADTPQSRPLFTADEMRMIQSYEKNWPEHAAAQATLMRAQSARIVDHVMTEVARLLQPVMDTTQGLAFNGHMAGLEEVIPDYHDIRDQVIAWARDRTQPEYLRAAYERVIAEGTAEEVKDLTDRWRAATGTAAAAAPAAAPAPAPAARDAGLSSVARQAAARLAPIASKVAATPVGAPSTFEDAFAAFAND